MNLQHKLLLAGSFLVISLCDISGQPADTTLTQNITGIQLIEATNSIRFNAGFKYDAQNTGAMVARVLPSVAGSGYAFTEQTENSSLPVNTSYPVGSIGGGSSVSPSGAASYAIPIDLPPGRHGLQPSLSIAYNSMGGDGMLGLGWDLSGSSSITRCGYDYYHEGMVYPVNLTSSDSLMLDGNRLIRIGTGIYRTENETFSKITAISNYFKVETKDGLILWYGSTTDSRVEVQGDNTIILFWALSKVEDRSGNYFSYTYSENNSTGEHYLTSITYTHASDITGDNSVNFYYKLRNTSLTSYVRNHQVLTNKLLDSIAIKNGTTRVFSYKLKYDNNRLNEIIKYGKSTSRLNPILVEWGDSINGLADYGHSRLYNPIAQKLVGDFNGDGRSDLLLYNNAYSASVYIADANGDFDRFAPITITLPQSTKGIVQLGDFNGDGKADVICVSPNNDTDTACLAHIYLSTGTSFNTVDFDTCAKKTDKFLVGDFNGDGKPELAVLTTAPPYYNQTCSFIQFNTGNATFQVTAQGEIDSPGGDIYPAGVNENFYNSTGIRYLSYINNSLFDYNGDGAIDILASDETGFAAYESGIYGGSTTEFMGLDPSKLLVGDFNGDGKSDIFLYKQNTWKVFMSKGEDFLEKNISTFNGFLTDSTKNNFFTADMNGDGLTDIVAIGKGTNPYNSNCLHVAYSTNDDFKLQTYTNITFGMYLNPVEGNYFTFADFNGDGVDEIYYESSTEAKLVGTFQGREQFYVKEIKNEMGYSSFFDYAPITDDAVYSNGSASTFPVVSFRAPIYVVSASSTENTDHSVSRTSYLYQGAKMHVQGKGFLGFEKFTAQNTSINLKTVSEFGSNSTFYNIFPTNNKVYLVSSDSTSETLISQASYTNNLINFGSKRIFPYVDASSETNYLAGTSITKDYSFDTNGNQTYYREDFDDGSYNVMRNSSFSSAGSHLPSKPDTISVKRKHGHDNQTPDSLVTTLTYNSTTGAVTSKSTGPLTTYYNFDPYGNTVSVRVSDGSVSRLDSFVYDSKKLFVLKSINNLNQVTRATYDSTNGNILSETAPNTNIITTYNYDNFGTLTSKKTSAFNQLDSIRFGWLTGTRPLGALFYKEVRSAGAPRQKEYYDAYGRVLKTEIEGFDGTLIYTSKKYNNKGQLIEETAPYKQSETPLKKVYTYTPDGRIEMVASLAGKTFYSYLGKATTVSTSTSSQTTTKTVDSQGNLISSSDPGGTISYSYKNNGQPGTISTNGSSCTMSYDSYGRQTSLTDPNSGTTTYNYNNFGELVKQTDARGKTDSLTYDALGRVKKEIRSEGVKEFTYDPSGNPGMLQSVTYPGGSTRYTYNTKGQVQSVLDSINKVPFTTSYVYDRYGRDSVITYPSSFGIINVYNQYGYLDQVRRKDNNNLIWDGVSMNSYGQFTQVAYGNNLTTTKTFDCLGLLRTITTGTVQNLSYSFNPENGNLISRRDNLRNLQEIFSYDDLDRLTQVTGPAPMTMSYAQNGNIASKTSVGDYSYGTKPHAVTSVTNPDGLIDTTGQQITYTSFNKVESIIEGTARYTIQYGFANERTLSKSYTNGVWQKKTYYVGNYEMDSIAGSSYPKNIHYIYGGDGIAAIYITQYSTTNMYYVHTDHLGSIDVMTNQSGTAVQYMSFDAWGRRRNHTDWTYTNVPTSFLVSRGYTMHEHLDQFGLINMNGRVYDPILGRFLEPDNYVQASGFTQSYNRFSYCWNNPLKYTDPSGYFSWRKFWAATVSAVVGVGVTILTGGNAAVGAWAGAFAGEMIRSGGDVVKSVNAGGKSIFGVALGLGMGQALRAIGGLKAPGWGLLNLGNGKFVPPMNNTISTLANRMTRNINITPLIEGISNGTLFNAAGGSNFSWVVSSLFQRNSNATDNISLYFNGHRMNIMDESTGSSIYSTRAYSGRALDNGSFDYSVDRQKLVGNGPIPEGNYYINANEVQTITPKDVRRGTFGVGAWPGGKRSWGERRVWIQPMPGTETYGRSGFSIHGGYVPGSAGCIDLVENVVPFFNHLHNAGAAGQKLVILRVRY
ncbi:MAG: FG-GAP-like repeat-containing protein [Bacteroidales bacterium]